MQGISGLAEDLLASEERLCCMELVNSGIIRSVKEQQIPLAKEPVPVWIVTLRLMLVIKGDMKAWWNEGTAPCIIFSLINYT